MIKKYEEFINEIRFREVDDNGNDIQVEDRKENGTRVKLEIGPTVLLKSTQWNYNKLPLALIQLGSPYFDIQPLSNYNNIEETAVIRKGLANYDYLIEIDDDEYVISFIPFSEIMEEDFSLDGEDIELTYEEDYITIIQALVEKLRGETLHYVYDDFFMIEFISEEDVEEIMNGFDYDDFKDKFYNEFNKEISSHFGWKRKDFIEVNDGFIGADIKPEIIKNLDKIKDYVFDYWEKYKYI